MALDMVADWLSMVALKDTIKYRRDDGSVRTQVLPMGQGLVDWKSLVNWLVEHDFGGPLSFHSEFKTDTLEERIELTGKEVEHIRALEQSARAKA